MKSLRIVIALLSAIVALPVVAQTQGEVPLFKSQTDGRVTDYSISKSRAEKLPKWDPTHPNVPLSIRDAVGKADAWLRKRSPKIEAFVPSRIELGRVSYGPFFGLWYYTIGFDGVVGKQRMHSSGLVAVVLMDGSIVEPQPEK